MHTAIAWVALLIVVAIAAFSSGVLFGAWFVGRHISDDKQNQKLLQ